MCRVVRQNSGSATILTGPYFSIPRAGNAWIYQSPVARPSAEHESQFMDKQGAFPPPLGDLISRNASRLTAADTRLLDVLTGDPVRAAMENGKEVSLRAGVHPASAVRL